MNKTHMFLHTFLLLSIAHNAHAMQWLSELIYPPSIHELAARGDFDAVNARIEAGEAVDITDRAGNSALHHAAAGGHTDVAAALIGAGLSVEERNNMGRTPFSHACAWNQAAFARWLRDTHSADPHARDRYKNTPLMVLALCEEPDTQLLAELITACPDMNHRNACRNSVRDLIDVHT